MARILIVDDEMANLTVMKMLLTGEGHDVITCDNGTDAVDTLNKQQFDLMVSDIRMSPMNGIELLKEAQQISPEMKAIMLTAYSSYETAAEALDLGAHDYLKKPFQLDEFLAAVNKALSDG